MRFEIRVWQVYIVRIVNFQFCFIGKYRNGIERECGVREICFYFLRQKKIQYGYILRKIILEESDI